MRISRKAKKFGFTLAEVLITLTIIGVIAAMTVPTLLIKHQKQEYVTRLKKAYSTLANAIQMIPIEMGCSGGDYVCAGLFSSPTGDFNGLTIDGKTYEYSDHNQATIHLLSKTIKNTKVCYGEDYTTCVENNYNINPITAGYSTSTAGIIVLPDGAILSAFNNDVVTLAIDVNGQKGPNKAGRDIFYFHIASALKNNVTQGTLIPLGSPLDKTYRNFYWKDNCKIPSNDTYWYNRGCAGRVLEEGKMDY